mmetsp:Transcript_6134/g.17394  ORF Transcript_6134/g.17394 Transcript_6134/m.17394 type:complete len:211 (-) Transcript_6134:864-1496(-)
MHYLFLLVVQVLSVGNLSRLDQVLQPEKDPAGQAKVSNRVHRDTNDRILRAPHRVGGDRQRLGTLEGFDDIVHVDEELQPGSGRYRLLEIPIELLEVGRGRYAHPHHKVLVCDVFQRADDRGIGLVQILGRAGFRIIVCVAQAVLGMDRRSGAGESEVCAAGRIAPVFRTELFPVPLGHFEAVLKVGLPGDPVLSHGQCVALVVERTVEE